MGTSLIPFGTRPTELFQDFRREVDQLMSGQVSGTLGHFARRAG